MKRVLSTAAIIAVGVTGFATTSPASADDSEATILNARTAATPKTFSAENRSESRIQVKLAEGQDASVSDKKVSTTSASTVNSLSMSGAIKGLRPMVDKPAEDLAALKTAAEQASGDQQADMSLWFVADLGKGESMEDVLEKLNADPAVEIAEAQHVPVEPPHAGTSGAISPTAFAYASPDYTDRQTYKAGGDQHGIEALDVAEVPGGKGENVQVTDIEFGWTTGHEDLTQLARDGAYLQNGTPSESFPEHGTAVMGEVVGDENDFGVTGIAPKATPYVSNATSRESGFTPGAAITLAAETMEAGDVILLEMQLNGCGGGFAPVEIDNAAHDAIKTATAKGIHVVEAAGNGNQNLDQQCYGGDQFPSGRGDSGAIIVGAGASSRSGRTPGEKLSFSTYGSRVNVHAWGEMVATTGYGDLQGGDATVQYTDVFSGTSSASPIVTGAVALISSIAQEKGVELSPADMRSLLEETGKPQAGDTGTKIGPLPQVKAAVDSLDQGE